MSAAELVIHNPPPSNGQVIAVAFALGFVILFAAVMFAVFLTRLRREREDA